MRRTDFNWCEPPNMVRVKNKVYRLTQIRAAAAAFLPFFVAVSIITQTNFLTGRLSRAQP